MLYMKCCNRIQFNIHINICSVLGWHIEKNITIYATIYSADMEAHSGVSAAQT